MRRRPRAMSVATVLVLVASLTWAATGASRAGAYVAHPPAAAPTPADVDPTGELTSVTPARIFDTRDGTGQGGIPAPVLGGIARTVQVAGQGGLPVDGLSAVVMNVTVTNPTIAGWLRVWPTGTQPPTVSNLNFTRGQTVPNLVTVVLAPGGTVDVSILAGTADVIFDVVGAYVTATGQPGGRFHGIAPARLLDTRFVGPVGPGQTIPLQVTGRAAVPPTGVSAVVLNITATEPSLESYLTVWPSDAPRPLASNLNFVPGQTVPNLVVARVPANGVVDIYNFAGFTNVVVDVTGYFNDDRSTEAGRYLPLLPYRVLDTRVSPPPLGEDEIADLYWVDDQGLPLPWLGGVIVNVTATEPTSAGYLTVFPSDTPLPLASNVNFVAGQTVPNLVMVGLSPPDVLGVPPTAMAIYNRFGQTQVVVDVFGGFTSAYQA